MLLAIDTSTTQAGLACYDASGLLAECNWLTGRDHTVQVLPQLEVLLQHLGRSVTDLRAIAIALGPGSWSGLRVGMSIAKGFALARDLPLIGIGTLDALAYQHLRPGLTVCPIIRLGRERFAAARFSAPPVAPYSAEAHNVTLAQLAESTHGAALFCGDTDSAVQENLSALLGSAAQFATPAANIRRAGFLAELAWQRLQAGQTDNRATLEPIYLGQAVKSPPSL